MSPMGWGPSPAPLSFRRLWRKRRKAPRAMRAITTMPPTTPPTMAPIGALEDEEGVGEGEVGLLIGADGGLLTLVDTVRDLVVKRV
jgi:hypothetical protein